MSSRRGAEELVESLLQDGDEYSMRTLCQILGGLLVRNEPIPEAGRAYLASALYAVVDGADPAAALGLSRPGGRPGNPPGKLWETWIIFNRKRAALEPAETGTEIADKVIAGGSPGSPRISREDELNGTAIAETAEELGVTERTVRGHLKALDQQIKRVFTSLAEKTKEAG